MKRSLLAKSFILIYLSLSSLLLLSLFIFPEPIFAQSRPCDCWYVEECDPATGAQLSGTNFYFACPGQRLDHTISNAAGNCLYVPTCGDVCKCTACVYDEAHYPGGAIPGDEVAQYRDFCESGAYCGHTDPISLAGGVFGSEPGLFSTVFKKCYCGYANLIQDIVNIGYTVVGTLALVMFAIGGWKYIFSRNDPEKLVEAKSTLTAAVAGLVFVLLSIAVLNLLDSQLAPWGIRFLEY